MGTEEFGYVAITLFGKGCSFRRGFEAVMSSRHPNIVTTLQIFEGSFGTPLGVMTELCRDALAEVLHEKAGRSHPVVENTYERLSAAIDIAHGLKFLHTLRLMHRE